jgi:hypothetical protein
MTDLCGAQAKAEKLHGHDAQCEQKGDDHGELRANLSPRCPMH